MTAFLRRTYDGGGTSTTLSTGMGASDVSFNITSASGWPGAAAHNFIVVVDGGNSNEERILCSSNSGTVVTVSGSSVANRGYDGTSATTHNAGAPVALCGGAIDFDETNQISNLLGNLTAGQMIYGAGTGTLPSVLSAATEGKVLAAGASGTPTWVAAGTAGQAFLSNGSSSTPSFQSAIPLDAIDSAITGAPPSAPGPFLMIAGTHSVSFSSGTGSITFPGGGFPSGVLAMVLTSQGNGGVAAIIQFLGAVSKTTATVYFDVSGSGFTGSSPVSYIAIGF